MSENGVHAKLSRDAVILLKKNKRIVAGRAETYSETILRMLNK